MKRNCQRCGGYAVTSVEHEFPWFIYPLILFILFAVLYMNLYVMLALLLLVPLMRRAVHSCSRCMQPIGTVSLSGLPSFSDPVSLRHCHAGSR